MLPADSQAQTLALDSNHVYESKLIGWRMQVPNDWHLMSDSVRSEKMKLVAKSINVEFNKKNSVLLLTFKKHIFLPFPNFNSGLETLSSLTRIGVKTETDYIELFSEVLKSKVVKNNEITFTVSDVKIDNKDFKKAIFLIKNSPNRVVCLVRKINTYMFYMTYVFENEEDENILMNAINTSTFE